MIWALLAILIFGGGSSAPFLHATKIVEKQQKQILVDTAREREANQSLNNIKGLYKEYQKSCCELASPFESVVKRRNASTEEYLDVLRKFDDAEKSWEDKIFQALMDYKSHFSPSEWALLFKIF
ncbi:MAG: hypothetical protein KBG07_03145 [Elusimicrobia bacterium]|nr:hypothetical protein [Elusimicrobiota bacterium]